MMGSTKNMLITGVGGAIGSQLAGHFLGEGYRVLGLDIQSKAPAKCAGHDEFVYTSCDLKDPEATTRAIEDFIKKNGAIDVVINNVGLIFNSPLIRFEEGNLVCHSFEEWNKVLSVSLSSAFYVSATCVKHLVMNNKKGTIINISSICAKGNPGQAAYSAAKAGLNGLTYALAKELGPLGIRVVSIAPGFLDTTSTHDAVSEDKLVRLRKTIPLKRLGNVAELVHAVEFVIDNSYYTGTTLELDGGLTI